MLLRDICDLHLLHRVLSLSVNIEVEYVLVVALVWLGRVLMGLPSCTALVEVVDMVVVYYVSHLCWLHRWFLLHLLIMACGRWSLVMSGSLWMGRSINLSL